MKSHSLTFTLKVDLKPSNFKTPNPPPTHMYVFGLWHEAREEPCSDEENMLTPASKVRGS